MKNRVHSLTFILFLCSMFVSGFSVTAIAQDSSFTADLKSSYAYIASHKISLEKTAPQLPSYDVTLNPSFKPYYLTNKTGNDSSIFRKGDATYPDKRRMRLIAAANIIGYGGTMVGLYSAWYSQYPQSKFHFFDDNNEWKQVDKVGHLYSAYVESNGSMELWRWTGMKRKQRIWIGGLSGIAYQTMIETLDGFSSEWGWSWGDMTANVLGSGLVIGQELLWDDQRIKIKFSTHNVDYKAADLNKRADVLYGESFSERFLKDYNGQTYWASANLKSFFPKSNIPKWLNVAFGYGADGMFGATENYGKDEHGNIFSRPDITRYRQYYIAPDIDLTKIKTKRILVRLALIALNSFKFPAPSIEYNSKGQVLFHWIHF